MPDYKSPSRLYNARLSTLPLPAVTQAPSMADLIAVPLTSSRRDAGFSQCVHRTTTISFKEPHALHSGRFKLLVI